MTAPTLTTERQKPSDFNKRQMYLLGMRIATEVLSDTSLPIGEFGTDEGDRTQKAIEERIHATLREGGALPHRLASALAQNGGLEVLRSVRQTDLW